MFAHSKVTNYEDTLLAPRGLGGRRADGCANGRIVGEGMAERAERCVGGVVGCIRAATGGLLSKICLGALARAGRAGVGPSRIESVSYGLGATPWRGPGSRLSDAWCKP